MSRRIFVGKGSKLDEIARKYKAKEDLALKFRPRFTEKDLIENYLSDSESEDEELPATRERSITFSE